MSYRWDGFSLDVEGHLLTGPDGQLHVEPQVFEVLALLIEERHRVIPKAEILDRVWGDHFVSESALATRIKQARRCLGDDGRTQKYIRNVHGRGYQFIGQISSTVRETKADRNHAGPAPSLARSIALDDEYPFVGREPELDTCLQAVAENVGATQIYIGGAPGTGKSRLAVELLERAASTGAYVCAARCEASMTSALQAVRDAFSNLVAANPDRLETWSSGLEGQLLSLLPSLGDRLDVEPVAVDAYAGIDVFLAVFERAAREAPVVMAIDDLQWSDDPTRSFISRLHRHHRDRDLVTVSTYRSGREDLPTEVYQWIGGQRRDQSAVMIDLADLDEAAVIALIERVVGIDGSAVEPSAGAATASPMPGQIDGHKLFAATGGHCLFLTESLRDIRLGGDGAETVAELIIARLNGQSDEVQTIVRTAALLGPEFDFSIASAASGVDPIVALEAVDRAIDAELLHETEAPDRFRFSHQLVPEAIDTAMSRSERVSTHHACAIALADAGADPAEVAFHRLGAVPLVALELAVADARNAAVAARSKKQFDRALRLLERVLPTEPSARVRAEVQLEIGLLFNDRGTPALGADHLESVAESSRKNGWTDLFVEAALGHWSQSPYRRPRQPGPTLDLLVEAQAMLGGEDSVELARVLAKSAVFQVFSEPFSVRLAASSQAVEMGDRANASPRHRLELLEAQAITATCPAGWETLNRVDPEIAKLRLEIDTYFNDAAAPETGALMRGDGPEFRRVGASDAGRISEQPIAEWRDFVLKSTLAAFAGDFDQARTLCIRGGEIGEVYWGESAVSLLGFGHFFVDMLCDDFKQSLEYLELLVAFDGSPVFRGPLALARAKTGDRSGGQEILRSLAPDRLPQMGEHIVGGNGLVGVGLAAVALDDEEMIEACIGALLPFRKLMLGLPWAASLAAADVLATLADYQGQAATADEHRAEARRVYERLDAPGLIEHLGPPTG